MVLGGVYGLDYRFIISMSTIDRIQGFRVVIFSNEPENERPHVHFIKENNDAKVWLDDLSFATTDRYSKGDLRKISKIVAEKHQAYLTTWQELKG